VVLTIHPPRVVQTLQQGDPAPQHLLARAVEVAAIHRQVVLL
jgi:hypothetical protein